jgi:multicomponent Na+:H+ antiporter subunit E
LLSGKMDGLHLGSGLLLALGLATFYYPWTGRDNLPVLRLAAYLPWLLTQIVISNLRVARLVLTRGRFEPVFIRQSPGVRSDWARTLLGCSITLTPGTLTLEVEGEDLVVHALDTKSEKDIRSGAMSRRVAAVFQEQGE